MKPSQIKSEYFTQKSIIYHTPEFTIAYGICYDDIMRLAMRWNGENDDDIGYPSKYGQPEWFYFPENLTIKLLFSIIEQSQCNSLETLLLLRDCLCPSIEASLLKKNTEDKPNGNFLLKIYNFNDLYSECKSSGEFSTLEEAMKYVKFVPSTWTEITDQSTGIIIYCDKVKMSEMYYQARQADADKYSKIL